MGKEFGDYEIGSVVPEQLVYELVRGIHYQEDDFDEGNLGDMIEEYENYELIEVNVSDLHDVFAMIDDYLVFEYSDMDISTMPPIVLGHFDNGEYLILDGNHRITVLRNLGIETVKAFVGIK